MKRKAGLSSSYKISFGDSKTTKKVSLNKANDERHKKQKIINEQLSALSFTARQELIGDGQYDIDMGVIPESYDLDGNNGWQDIDSDEEEALSRPPPGEEGFNHSHAGKEDVFHQIYDQCVPGRHDSRKRTLRVQRTVDAWRRIMPELVDAYLALKMNGPVDSSENSEAWILPVIGFDELGDRRFIHTGVTANATLIQHGYLGASPERVTRAFPIRLFEIYRQLHRVCPRFTLDALGKTLTHLHQGPRLKTLTDQLSTAYDAYLEILRHVDVRVDAALKRDSAWYSGNVCAPCLYHTENEDKLKYSFLGCMDGNNSLKLVDSTFRPGSVRPDDRASTSFRWLSPEYVDTFKDEVVDSRKKAHTKQPEAQTEPSTQRLSPVPPPPEVSQPASASNSEPINPEPTGTDSNEDVAWLNELEIGADAEELKNTIDTCVQRWKAAGPEAQKKMFALFAISVSGTFIFQNYRQALEKITSNRSQLVTLEAELGTSADDYEKFHRAEVKFFQDLRSQPQSTQQASEYVDLLLKMHQARSESDEANRDFKQLDHHIINGGYTRPEIARVRTRYRTTWDKYLATQETTRRYEEEHNIETRWEPGSREWTDALALLTECKYREALTEVERLVVARLLELTKLGMSGVGE
ncbi:hypothetical protein MVEN_00005600 [Mycena venus]|uniref:CxC1-like cysteine cluster associated with KDZ transposases domain-containing protein n=1 Tax=Mycena venus TaxID=2733690 RepID=A0A8H6Z2P3_9AGAR|nr:hypothetical protein MVEN_00005600 [Mycena venus]